MILNFLTEDHAFNFFLSFNLNLGCHIAKCFTKGLFLNPDVKDIVDTTFYHLHFLPNCRHSCLGRLKFSILELVMEHKICFVPNCH